MDLPAELRGQSKSQLATHGVEVFKTELTGTKTDMIDALTKLYASKNDAPPVSNEESNKSVLESISDASDEAAGLSPYEAPDTEVLPEMISGNDNPMPTQAIAPETHKVDSAEYTQWPSNVKWLYNPKTGCRFIATDQLRLRMDLVPCAAPKDKYIGK